MILYFVAFLLVLILGSMFLILSALEDIFIVIRDFHRRKYVARTQNIDEYDSFIASGFYRNF